MVDWHIDAHSQGYTTDAAPDLENTTVQSMLMWVCKQYQYIVVEVVEPFKLHPTSI